MRAIFIMPSGIQEGNLIWHAPYLYPKIQLEEAIEGLRNLGYIIEPMATDDDWECGLAFQSPYSPSETRDHIRAHFRWINFVFHDDEGNISLKKDLETHCLIAMPIGRLQIETAIITETVCLFPPGEFRIYNPYNLDGTPFENSDSKVLRDYITHLTPIDTHVFEHCPLIVFRKKMTYEEFRSFDQQDDAEFIKECSVIADNLMDLIRFFNADYLLQEWLPSKAGIWADRHSAAFVYFPGGKAGHIICREVELRSFIMGIGMTVEHTDEISLHPLLFREINDFEKIIRHALRLHTLIMETDDESMKFTQIFILLDFLGDPYEYNNFKITKKQLIPCLVSTEAEYHILADRFNELTNRDGLRTSIMHMGKRIQEVMPHSRTRKNLFEELHGIVHGLLLHMMFSEAQTWEEYVQERDILRKRLFAAS